MKPQDIPTHIAGYRFDDSAINYDPIAKLWHDNSRFKDPRQSVTVINGTPTFDNSGPERGWLMDNTCHADFLLPIPWEGTILLAMRPIFTGSGSQEVQLMLFGDLSTSSSNGRLRLQHNSGQLRTALVTAGGGLTRTLTRAGTGQIAGMWSLNQSLRTMNLTEGGADSPLSTPAHSNGNAMSLCTTSSGSNQLVRSRLGVLENDIGNTIPRADLRCVIYEMHYFKGDLIKDDLPSAQAVTNRFNKKYQV